jgi:hypothetical protein
MQSGEFICRYYYFWCLHIFRRNPLRNTLASDFRLPFRLLPDAYERDSQNLYDTSRIISTDDRTRLVRHRADIVIDFARMRLETVKIKAFDCAVYT